MNPITARKTADQRREEILVAAMEEFAEHGLHGTSTDTIAEKAGVSQPYLFRLFGTKKELYLESVRRCLRQTLEVFHEATVDKSGEAALEAIGTAYGVLLRDRTRLQAQMQAYAACGDEDVREVVRSGYGELVEFVEHVSGAEPERIRDFFAFGMLLNVFASMDLLDQKSPWAKRLLDACFEQPNRKERRL
ncbi:MAG TPA: TetR/AcrR family transcriptional regulator [Gaiellaceae bacterium]|nr:TetR/AcrR family transcriptional regulator [Gaiellaceae bacterium]